MRPIEKGLPLRCFDIMGCGGFLMTNYQEELEDMFQESDGTYYGIGSYVTMDETRNLPMLYAIFEESPAADVIPV